MEPQAQEGVELAPALANAKNDDGGEVQPESQSEAQAQPSLQQTGEEPLQQAEGEAHTQRDAILQGEGQGNDSAQLQGEVQAQQGEQQQLEREGQGDGSAQQDVQQHQGEGQHKPAQLLMEG